MNSIKLLSLVVLALFSISAIPPPYKFKAITRWLKNQVLQIGRYMIEILIEVKRQQTC